MSFLYPRTITVWRLPAQNAAGAQGYIGQTESQLQQQPQPTPVPIQAAVQQKKDSGAQPAHLPADVSKRLYWWISTIPGPQPTDIRTNDEIHDDLGCKYQVVGSYLTAFGNWQCVAEKLEA